MQGYESGYEKLEQVFRRMVLVIRRKGAESWEVSLFSFQREKGRR